MDQPTQFLRQGYRLLLIASFKGSTKLRESISPSSSDFKRRIEDTAEGTALRSS
jgi:hypothetical protein